jgi:hypothetical protein
MASQIRLYFGPSVASSTEVTKWLKADGNLQWTKSVDQNWTAQFYLDSISPIDGTNLLTALGGRPAVGQPYWITETLLSVQTVRFSGLISQILETSYSGSGGRLIFQVTGSGWTTVCDHRVITAVYDAGETTLSVIQDIYNQTISADGIAFTDVDGFTLIPTPLTFNPDTVTDAFNQIRTLTNQQWWIDENKGFHFKLLGTESSGITIDNAHQNIMQQDGPTGPPQITTTTANYRNVQYELTSQPVGSQSRTETIIIGAIDGFFQVVDFPIDTAPTITLNGVAQTIYQFGVDAFGKAGWYWQMGSNTLQQGQQISPGAGVTMVVTYDALTINYTVDTAAAQVSARAAIEGTSGKWENIDQQATIPNATVGHSYGQGNLTNFGVIPQVVVFDTYVSGFDEQVGKYIIFNFTLNALVGNYVITDIAATHVPGLKAPSPATGGQILYTVTCTNEMFTGNYVQWFLGLAASIQTAMTAASTAVALAGAGSQGSPPTTPVAAAVQSEVEGWTLGASDQTGAGGLILTSSLAVVPVGRVNFQNSGNITRVSVSARIPPQGQNLVIDILRATAAQQTGSPPCATGTSIFVTGADSNKLVLPDSQCFAGKQTIFTPEPFPVVGMDTFTSASPPVAVVPDLFTVQAKYVATSGTLVNAQDVVIEIFVQF